MKKSRRFFITGAIQPVFFNKFIKDNADKLNVKGFVRNLENGQAEIFIEGNIEAVNDMSQICRRGPEHSQIRNVEEKEEKFQGFKEFRVLKI